MNSVGDVNTLVIQDCDVVDETTGNESARFTCESRYVSTYVHEKDEEEKEEEKKNTNESQTYLHRKFAKLVDVELAAAICVELTHETLGFDNTDTQQCADFVGTQSA